MILCSSVRNNACLPLHQVLSLILLLLLLLLLLGCDRGCGRAPRQHAHRLIQQNSQSKRKLKLGGGCRPKLKLEVRNQVCAVRLSRWIDRMHVDWPDFNLRVDRRNFNTGPPPTNFNLGPDVNDRVRTVLCTQDV